MVKVLRSAFLYRPTVPKGTAANVIRATIASVPGWKEVLKNVRERRKERERNERGGGWERKGELGGRGTKGKEGTNQERSYVFYVFRGGVGTGRERKGGEREGGRGRDPC